MLLYSLFCFAGALVTVEVIWDAINIVNAGLLLINLFGLIFLLPRIRKDVIAQMRQTPVLTKVLIIPIKPLFIGSSLPVKPNKIAAVPKPDSVATKC